MYVLVNSIPKFTLCEQAGPSCTGSETSKPDSFASSPNIVYEYMNVFYHIMRTCPCYVDPITPHFYIVKFGFTWVYSFSYFGINIDCGYS